MATQAGVLSILPSSESNGEKSDGSVLMHKTISLSFKAFERLWPPTLLFSLIAFLLPRALAERSMATHTGLLSYSLPSS